MALFNNFPYTDLNDINLDYTLQKLESLYTRGEQLYSTLTTWQQATDAELEQWKAATESSLALWKTQTENSIDTKIQLLTAAINAAFTDLRTQLEAHIAEIETTAVNAASAASASATAAAGAASAASINNEQSKEWAIGETLEGDPVPDTNPAYENNAKYYADLLGQETAQIDQNTADITDLKSAIEQTRQVINIRSLYTASSQIALNVGIGNTVNPTPESTTGTASLVYPCKAGDKFDINGSGYITYRLWGLTDGDYKLLSVSDAPPPNTRHDIVTATQDGYFISNINTNLAATVTVTTIKDYTTQADVENIFADDIKPYDDILKESKNIKNLFRSPYKINSNVGIGNTVDPTPVSETACGCLCYPCKKGDKFTLTGTGYSSIRLWAFTDTAYKLLSIKSGSGTETNAVYTAGQDGYFIVNVNTNKTYNLSVYTFKDISALTRFDALFPTSRFYKPVSWVSSDLGDYIHVTSGEFNLFTSNTTAAQYYDLWNDLVTASNGYITASELGLASDNATMMYAYTLKSASGYKGVKLFVVCGQHGFEKAAPFGLYYFVRELVDNYRNNSSLMYLRNWCELVIMPLQNPYGFDNNVYTNANGVNLNRNWPTSVWRQGTAGTTSYGGPSAGSEVETQYAVSLFSANDDALILTDLHTNGQVAVDSYLNVMWQAFESDINEDEYSKLCVEAAKKEINDLSSAFCVDYTEDCPTYTQIGHYSLDTATGGLASIYAREHNMLGQTVEGFPGWPNGTTYKPSCHQANADIFANWLRCVLAVYERLGGNKYAV